MILSSRVRRVLSSKFAFACFFVSLVLPRCARNTWAFDEDQVAFFEERIRPVLVEHCYECHSARSGESKGGLLLDSRKGVTQGGDSGSSIDLVNSDQSLILNALRYDDLKMPPSGKLSDQVIDDFAKWIAMGAPDPREEAATVAPSLAVDWEGAKNFWSFQPRPAVNPAKASSAWCRNPIDSFIEQKRNTAGVQPVEEASRATWLRRVYIDLVGIPPTPEESMAFEQSVEPDIYERTVDALLASPTYGQRWGRYWLDLARYADSNGADENHAYPVAWRYRDYVVDSFNRDTPYDLFVREQLAGDLLISSGNPEPSPSNPEAPLLSEAEQRRLIAATGFLVIGPKMLAEQDKPKLVADLVDEQIDTVGKVFLGLTIGCARCHDHKFDPILASDYYALASIFHSTKSMEHLNHVAQWNERELPDSEIVRNMAVHDAKTEQANLQVQQLSSELMQRHAIPADSPEPLKQLESVLNDSEKESLAKLKQVHEELTKSRPKLPKAMAVQESEVRLVSVHVRGNHLQMAGEPLPPAVPTILRKGPVTDTLQMAPTSSGRLELANWIADTQNPLTARVMVNRIWQGHFGSGLVATGSNFGLRGQLPTHPELLDWLANTFVENDWSIKDLHRLIVLSSTYRMSTGSNSDSEKVDPDNRLLWRQNRRRLEIEPLRDSLLSMVDLLDTRVGGEATAASAAPDARAVWAGKIGAARRTVYLEVNRAAMSDFLTTFDFVEPGVSVDRRPTTIVPHQALYLMNHPLPLEVGRQLANQIWSQGGNDAQRLEQVVRRVYGRSATSVEKQIVQSVASSRKDVQDTAVSDSLESLESLENCHSSLEIWVKICRAMLLTNEFLYVE
jgi:hypothetical protein